MSTKAAERSRNKRRARVEAAMKSRSRRRLQFLVWTIALVVIGGVVTAMMLNSRPTSSSVTRAAADFSLVNTAGDTVRLSEYRGHNVILYFSEGAGCQSCLVQMGEIERYKAQFAALDVTVLPIVMNTRDQITRDMAANGVTTPFLLDDGTVSKAYDTLGKGMHAGLPGHSFVLIDANGTQRWYGEYPSMWLAPQDLLADVRSRLDG
jgi:peroxiredoxin